MKKENTKNPYAILDFTVKAPKEKREQPKGKSTKSGGDLRGGKK